MAGPVFTNNAVGTLAAAYGPGATALTLTAGQGARFPSPLAGEWFPVTVVDVLNNIEIVKCTARIADTLTVVRGQEGTVARNLGVGEKVEHRLTAAALIAIRDRALDPTQNPDASITAAKLGLNAVTNPAIADNAVTARNIQPGQVNASHLWPGTAEANLGFSPVQQGGGAGQGTNKIYMGWSGTRVKLQVDGTDLGNLLTAQHNGDPSGAGYRGMVINDQNANYVMGLTDAGRQVVHYAGSHTYYLPDDSVPFQRGIIINIVNLAGGLTLQPSGGAQIVWVPSGAVGGRTLAANGMCVAMKVNANIWWVSGPGLS